jgi:3',5'-cyclic AMP phosphodiesterase CpdA
VKWNLRDYFSKHTTGWFNYKILGRGSRFRRNDEILAALRRELETNAFDQVVMTGDVSSFGLREEFAAAAENLPLQLPGVITPGNHDYYTKASRVGGNFEKTFRNWQEGERIEAALYPFAKKVGDFWIVAVCSATENRGFWDARGRVGDEQLARFDKLCERLEGPKILATHYPMLLRKGQPEHPGRQLRDADKLAKLVKKHKFLAWLHGHRHRSFWYTPTPKHPYAMICSGSVTHKKRWMYLDILVSPHSIELNRRMYSPKTQSFYTIDVITIPLHANLNESECNAEGSLLSSSATV